MWAMMLGGSEDGQIIETVNHAQCVVVPVPREPVFHEIAAADILDDFRRGNDRVTYRYECLATPDGWRQPIWVHPSIPPAELANLPDNIYIKAIMAPWRKERQGIQLGPLLGPTRCFMHSSEHWRCRPSTCGRPQWITPSHKQLCTIALESIGPELL